MGRSVFIVYGHVPQGLRRDSSAVVGGMQCTLPIAHDLDHKTILTNRQNPVKITRYVQYRVF